MRTTRTTKILGFSVPPAMVKEVESLARQEGRTKSELFREMVRVYQKYRLQRDRDELRWISGIIDEAKAEEATRPTTAEALLAEDNRLARYGQQQAKKAASRPTLRALTASSMSAENLIGFRVVLDTNVYVSAFNHAEGTPAKIWRQALARRFTLIISPGIIVEIARVLRDVFRWQEAPSWPDSRP